MSTLRAAAVAYKDWKRVPVAERARLQHAVAALMRRDAEEIAKRLTLELLRRRQQSGLGREKSRHGLDEYLEYKTVYLGL